MPSAVLGRNYARAGKFGAVGILNTAIDFGIFNLMFAVFGAGILVANVISTTIAMIFSFFANRHVVFKASDGSAMKQALWFFVVTAFGLYVLQLGILHLLTSWWTAPLTLVVAIAHSLGLGHVLSDRFIRNNSAKAVATVASLIWNYYTYKMVVFN